MKKGETTVCGDCGCLVANNRKHRDWHDRVVVVREAATTQIRFIGETADEPTDPEQKD